MSFGYSCCRVLGQNTSNITLYDVNCGDQSRVLTEDCSYDVFTQTECNRLMEAGCYEKFNCTEGDIRLMDGNSSLEGRVEICHQGLWGTIDIYRDGWRTNAAMVACRQLGYPWECELLYMCAIFACMHLTIIMSTKVVGYFLTL